MSTEAVIMLVVAVILLWGGLALAITNYIRADRSGRQDDVGA